MIRIRPCEIHMVQDDRMFILLVYMNGVDKPPSDVNKLEDWELLQVYNMPGGFLPMAILKWKE